MLCVVLCCAVVLCCTLYCAVLCCVVLCYVLCCAVSCRVVLAVSCRVSVTKRIVEEKAQSLLFVNKERRIHHLYKTNFLPFRLLRRGIKDLKMSN